MTSSCEREDKWLDEANYAIDTSMVPRGGSRRRKSMEPRMLSNMNGNLVPIVNEVPAKTPAKDVSPTTEFLTFDTPASRRETFIIDRQSPQEKQPTTVPATPIAVKTVDDDMCEEGSAWGSPTTPYYLSKGAELLQRTCPPNRMGSLLLEGGQTDETVQRRLLEARRKSMQWASRIRSPLGRTVSYGK